MLSGVNIIMGDLFGVDLVLESVQHSLDGLEGVSSLDHRFNLHHHFHDVSVLSLTQLVLSEQVRLEGVTNDDKSDKEQS